MIVSSGKTKGPASVGALPSHGSINPRQDINMNSTDTITAAPAASSPFGHLPGANQRDDVVTKIANLGSLFTVCALAVNDAENWSDDVACRVRQEIRSVLEWGALLTGDVQLEVERKMEALS